MKDFHAGSQRFPADLSYAPTMIIHENLQHRVVASQGPAPPLKRGLRPAIAVDYSVGPTLIRVSVAGRAVQAQGRVVDQRNGTADWGRMLIGRPGQTCTDRKPHRSPCNAASDRESQ